MTTTETPTTYADANGNLNHSSSRIGRLLRAALKSYVAFYETRYAGVATAEATARLRWTPIA